MYIKITRSGDKSYVQLAESYRNEQGKPRQRVVANLGPVFVNNDVRFLHAARLSL
ncbi:hypothetical protein [Pusillimonas sp. T2]|uniref:hypothetical protein n=1 Tax=Pusillimonas sp. T2 TaxID=1548123 RepID=UPI0013039BC4|nr:hypothetical protein [Pusillimonas sp. T2]